MTITEIVEAIAEIQESYPGKYVETHGQVAGSDFEQLCKLTHQLADRIHQLLGD